MEARDRLLNRGGSAAALLGALAMLWLLAGLPAAAQSLTGTSGLVLIPTAEMPADGTLAFGGGFVHKRYSRYKGGTHHYVPYYTSITYLPFLELGFRFSRLVDSPERQALGDRMVSVRLRLSSEGEKRPAVVVGAHDFIKSSDASTSRFNTLYLVLSKHFDGIPVARRIGVHAGYGSDVMDADSHQFVGLFGGLSASPVPGLDVLVEYDGDALSIGPRVLLFRHLQLVAALQNFDAVVAGGSVRFRL